MLFYRLVQVDRPNPRSCEAEGELGSLGALSSKPERLRELANRARPGRSSYSRAVRRSARLRAIDRLPDRPYSCGQSKKAFDFPIRMNGRASGSWRFAERVSMTTEAYLDERAVNCENRRQDLGGCRQDNRSATVREYLRGNLAMS